MNTSQICFAGVILELEDGETVVGYQNSPVWSEGCLLDLDAEGIHSLDEALVEVLLVFVWIMC